MDELSNSRLMIQGFNQEGQRAVGIIRMQLTMEDMYCRNGVVKKVFGDNKPFTEVESHFADAKYCIEDVEKGKEVLPPEEPKSFNNQNTRKNDSSTLKVELSKGMTLPLTQINMKQPSMPPLKGFVPSTQEEEGGHMALAINEKGFDLKAFKLLIKVGYDPKEKLSLGLGFTPPKLVRIAIKRVNNNYVSEGFSSTEDYKSEEYLRESVFNRLGPHRNELYEIANRQSVFDSANRQIVIFTQVQSDDEDDKESVASSNYINEGTEDNIAQTYHITLIEDGEVEEEDAEEAPAELQEGIKATIDELKEVNPSDIENPRPIYISASLTHGEEGTYIALLHEFKDVFAWSYKKMPGLDPKVMKALSFMDGSSGYNQIRMAPADEELMSNAMLMTWFGGIEIEQAKIDCILRMPEPRNIHELKSLQGKLAYLQRFISNLAGRCQPFSRLMKKDVQFQWDETCDKAFKSIKSYLMKPPVLVAPVPGRPLILYVAAQERSVGILLAQKNNEGKENALYYLSRTITPNELKYSPIEKLCLTLIFSIQKLKHYFQSHSIHLVSKANPLKYVMAKPVLSDRLAKWYLQLQQFEITYVPQKAVKGQVLVDFLADHPMLAEWELSDNLPDEDVLVIEVTPP
ncbi:UNVERIFIED_CONTAM: hypothetical protein Scaly_2964700 [Sesamum calycinum]|uniref:Reverse transcriptase/retrotransposon-derived protein RNase H-like domain-containing protein n=1 Tax=Sesamum calycinum TaxID=2727403 RepID=A0AAW2KLN0_9LAMI